MLAPVLVAGLWHGMFGVIVTVYVNANDRMTVWQ